MDADYHEVGRIEMCPCGRPFCYVAGMPPVPVSARLDAILSLLSPCQRLADVGTDHALIPVVAVQRGITEFAIASDLRAPPLVLARQNIARAGLAAQVTVLQGDGLRPLMGLNIEALVMAGMSGEQMVRLLRATPEVTAALSQLVLQPNQEVDSVRAWALESGLHVRAERMIEERSQFFPTCAFGPGQGRDPAYTHTDWSVQALCVLGPLLLAQKESALLRLAEQQRVRLGRLVARGARGRIVEHELWQRACLALHP
jgi:tRNA (adenine22-N1)-methyltransferase